MRLAFLLGAAASLAACSSSSGGGTPQDGGSEASAEAQATPTDGGDGGSTQDGATASDAQGDAPPACNALANVAQPVTLQQVAQDPPQPQGGTIADGIYTITAVTLYTGPGGPSGQGGSSQTTIQIAGTTVQVASAGDPRTQTVNLATAGTTFTATDTCPDSTVTHGSYTAAASTLLIFLDGGTDDAGTHTVVETLTKQ
jgi:hypothetical protein